MNVFAAIWIGLMAAGAAVTALSLREAVADRRAVRRAGINGNHRILADQAVRQELSSMLQHALLSTFVLWAILRSEPDATGHERYLFYRNCMATAISLIAAANSFLDLHDRHRVTRSLTPDASTGSPTLQQHGEDQP